MWRTDQSDETLHVCCVSAEMRSRSGTISPVRHEYDSVTAHSAIPRSSSVHDLLERHAAISRKLTGSFTAGEWLLVGQASTVKGHHG